MKILDVPHFSQLDNKYNPHGACNVTSMAMTLYYRGIRGDGSQPQLEDQIYQRFVSKGLSRHDPYHIKKVLETYPKIHDALYFNGTFEDIEESIDANNPVILHGYFTRFGHIIVVCGYDDEGFWVNDPYGEFFYSGYRTDKSGKRLHYSKTLIANTCSPESPTHPRHLLMHSVQKLS